MIIQNPLYHLPFYHITNVELFSTLETPEKYIRAYLDDKMFNEHIQSAIPDTNVLSKPCTYHTPEGLIDILANKHQRDLVLMHHNIRSLNKQYNNLLALITTMD